VPYHTIPIALNADDKIILEQEWFFLASSSPYESHLYKTLNNSDEAMTTKTELFNPGKDCVGCGVRFCCVAVRCVVALCGVLYCAVLRGVLCCTKFFQLYCILSLVCWVDGLSCCCTTRFVVCMAHVPGSRPSRGSKLQLQ
jgi:hypothetical protein